EPVQSSLVSSDFTSKLLNLKNASPADNEIASLMDTTTRHAIAVPEITTCFTTTIPPPPPFNDRVTNLEKDLSEIKQVDQYTQAISSISTIVDRYMDNKLEEVKTQLPKILPKAVLAFATPVIERNVTESLETAVLARSSSQPKSTYETATSLSEFELTKILLDKMEENKSHLRADYKKKLYDALVKSYNTDKDIFNIYGKVFTLKKSQDDNDKDRDLSDGSDRGTKKINQAKKLSHLEI
nr:hypothetical protein [Tanacetum cinerariifolium]